MNPSKHLAKAPSEGNDVYAKLIKEGSQHQIHGGTHKQLILEIHQY